MTYSTTPESCCWKRRDRHGMGSQGWMEEANPGAATAPSCKPRAESHPLTTSAADGWEACVTPLHSPTVCGPSSVGQRNPRCRSVNRLGGPTTGYLARNRRACDCHPVSLSPRIHFRDSTTSFFLLFLPHSPTHTHTHTLLFYAKLLRL